MQAEPKAPKAPKGVPTAGATGATAMPILKEEDLMLNVFIIRKKRMYFEGTLFFLVFLGLHPQHMEIPRLGVKSELQLTAAPDP